MSGPALLLVEDELGARRALAEYLHRCGYHVYEAAAAREAMRLWDAHRADLVLLDLGLPDLDGVDVIRPSSSTPWSSSPSSRFHCAAWHTAPPPRRSCCNGTC
jgi:DNA-binding response OmpR family regulator